MKTNYRKFLVGICALICAVATNAADLHWEKDSTTTDLNTASNWSEAPSKINRDDICWFKNNGRIQMTVFPADTLYVGYDSTDGKLRFNGKGTATVTNLIWNSGNIYGNKGDTTFKLAGNVRVVGSGTHVFYVSNSSQNLEVLADVESDDATPVVLIGTPSGSKAPTLDTMLGGETNKYILSGSWADYKGAIDTRAFSAIIFTKDYPLGDTNTLKQSALTLQTNAGIAFDGNLAQSANRSIEIVGTQAYFLTWASVANAYTVQYPIIGPGALIKEGVGTVTLDCDYSAGGITVNKGTLVVTDKATFPAGQAFNVAAGATLTMNCPTNGMTFAVADGGTLNVNSKTTTWTGEAGDGNWSNNDNWDNDAPVSGHGDTVVLTATSTNDIPNLRVASVVFAGAGTYELAGNAFTVTTANGLSISSAVTVTNNLAMTFEKAQKWTLLRDSNLYLETPLTFASSLTLNEDPGNVRYSSVTNVGSVYFAAANALAAFTNHTANVYACNDNAFGTADIVMPTCVYSDAGNANQANLAFLNLCGVTLTNNLAITDFNGTGDKHVKLRSAAGTTNVLSGTLVLTPKNFNYVCYVGADSQLTINRSISANQEKRFYVMGDQTSGVCILAMNDQSFYSLGGGNNKEQAVRVLAGTNTVLATYGLYVYENNKVRFDVDDVFGTSPGKKESIYDGGGSVDLNGHSQHMRGFSGLTGDTTTGIITSDSPAVLYMNQAQNPGGGGWNGKFMGAVSLVKSGTYALSLGGASTSTGRCEVTRSELVFTETGSWAGDIAVSGTGTLAVSNTTDTIKALYITANTSNPKAFVAIPEDATITVGDLYVNGVLQRGGTFRPSDFAFIKGGSIINKGESYEFTTTWTGEGGDGKWSTAGNWDDGVPNKNATVVLTATSTNDIENLSVKAVVFDGAAGYELAGNAITATETNGLSVAAAVTVTNNVAMEFAKPQNWMILTNATLNLNQPLTFASSLTLNEDPGTTPYSEVPYVGSVYFNAANTLAAFTNHTAIVYACNDNAFGTADIVMPTCASSTAGDKNDNKANLAFLNLCNVTLTNDIAVTDFNGTGGTYVKLRSEPGTTNVLSGTLALKPKSTYNYVCYMGEDSQLALAGRITSNRSSSKAFYYVMGNQTSGVCILAMNDQTFFSLGGGSTTAQAVRVLAGTNTVLSDDGIYVSVNNKVRFDVDDAFGASPSHCEYICDGRGAIDLNGHSQHIRGFKGLDSYTTNARISSDEPATLYFEQVNDLDYAWNGKFTGALSLVKAGDKPLSLSSASTATGTLEVAAGELLFVSKGAWAGDIAVRDTGTLAVSNTTDTIKALYVETDSTARVAIPAGQKVKVRDFSVNGVLQRTGTYDASAFGFIDGGMIDNLGVSGPTTTTWTGNGGDGKWSTPANWDNGVPAGDVAAILNATSTNDIENLSVKAVVFDGAAGYELAGNAITVTETNGLAVTSAVTVTNNVAMTFEKAQKWMLKKSSNLYLESSLTFASSLTLNDDPGDTRGSDYGYVGSVYFDAANTMTAALTNHTAIVYARNDGAFGLAEIVMPTTARASEANLANLALLWLCDVTLANDITLKDFANQNANQQKSYCKLRSFANTTNVLLGTVQFAQNGTKFAYVGDNSELTFAQPIVFVKAANFRIFGESTTTSVCKFTANGQAFHSLGMENCAQACIVLAGAETEISNAGLYAYEGNTVRFDADEVFGASPTKNEYVRDGRGTVDLNGHSQHIRGFNNLAGDTATGRITSATPAVLDVKQAYDLKGKSWDGLFTGAASLRVSGGDYPLVLGGASTSTGTAEVTAGGLTFAASGSWAGDLAVSGTGTLTLNNTTATFETLSVTTDLVSPTAHVAVPADQSVTVRDLSVNGELQRAGTYDANAFGFVTGGTITNLGENGPYTTTWTGNGGDGKWSTPANWDRGVPNGKTTVALNATSTNDIGNLTVVSVEFGGTGTYELAGNAFTVTAANGLGVSAIVTNDVNIAMTFAKPQNWMILRNATLNLNQPLDFASSLTLNEDPGATLVGDVTYAGTINFYAENVMPTVFTNHTAIANVYNDHAFGAAEIVLPTCVAKDKNDTSHNRANLASLTLRGVTLANDVTIREYNGSTAGSIKIRTPNNSTNTVSGTVRFLQSGASMVAVGARSVLTLGGPVVMDVPGFFYCMGNQTTSTCILAADDQILAALGGTSDHKQACLALAGTNMVISGSIGNPGIYVGYSDGNGRNNIRFDADEVFGASPSQNEFIRVGTGTLNLNGHSQHIRGFNKLASDTTTGRITSAAPAVLDIKQAYSVGAWDGLFTGAASLRVSGGDYPLVLGGASSSTGRCEVAAGTLVFTETGSWKGDIVVSGTGTLAVSNVDDKVSTLYVVTDKKNPTVEIYIPEGQTLTVDDFYVNGVLQRSTTLGPSECKFIKSGSIYHKAKSHVPATKIWITKKQGAKFSEAANWSDGAVPYDGDILCFTNSCTVANDTPECEFTSVTLSNSVVVVVNGNGLPSPTYNLGNSAKLHFCSTPICSRSGKMLVNGSGNGGEIWFEKSPEKRFDRIEVLGSTLLGLNPNIVVRTAVLDFHGGHIKLNNGSLLDAFSAVRNDGAPLAAKTYTGNGSAGEHVDWIDGTAPMKVGSVTVTENARMKDFLDGLKGLSADGKWLSSWRSPWSENGSSFRKKVNGEWIAKEPEETNLDNSRVYTAIGIHPYMGFYDLSDVAGTWYTDLKYEQQRAQLRGIIRSAYARWGFTPVFSWHMENPYTPSGCEVPPYKYRWTDEGETADPCPDYPAEHRYVLNEILVNGGSACGTGRKDESTGPEVKNPKRWFDERLDEIASFIDSLRDEDGKRIPIVIRLFHECEDNWSYWCRDGVTIADYKTIFAYTANAIRWRTGGDGTVVFAYCTDKNCDDYATEKSSYSERDDKYTYMARYPGDDIVDIIGYDDYSIGKGTGTAGKELILTSAIGKIQKISTIAANHDKACGMFETGVVKSKPQDEAYYWHYQAMTNSGCNFAFLNTWGDDTIPTNATGLVKMEEYMNKPEVVDIPNAYFPTPVVTATVKHGIDGKLKVDIRGDYCWAASNVVVTLKTGDTTIASGSVAWTKAGEARIVFTPSSWIAPGTPCTVEMTFEGGYGSKTLDYSTTVDGEVEDKLGTRIFFAMADAYRGSFADELAAYAQH